MSWDDYREIPYCARCFQMYEKCTCKNGPDIRAWERPYSFTWERLEVPKPKPKKGKYSFEETSYYDGQADALAFLNGDVSVDDEPTAPLHRDLTTDFLLWCIGINLAVAGGLKRAEHNGKMSADEWNRRKYRRF